MRGRRASSLYKDASAKMQLAGGKIEYPPSRGTRTRVRSISQLTNSYISVRVYTAVLWA